MARRRGDFGSSWWADAWLEALEDRASLDPNRLPRGRTYARQSRATSLVISPGEVRAKVQGSRSRPYDVRVVVRRFDEEEWDRVLEAIAAKAGHAAALLDGDMEPGIVDGARAVGVELLPDAGDLQPRCSCPDWADPCKHSAAVCYLVARELDSDPFTLFLLRGRERDDVLSALRRIRSSSVPVEEASGEEADPGVRATDAWSRTPEDPPIPPPAKPRVGIAAAWHTDPPPDAPFTADGLRTLAGDAARRAWLMYRGDATSGLGADHAIDLARRAAAALGTTGWSGLVANAGVDQRRLERLAIAWRHGGAAGVGTVGEPAWRPDPRIMATARQAIVDAGAPTSRISVRMNAITVDDVQIRLGGDGRWWRFEKQSGAWQLSAPPADQPDDLLP